MVKSANTIALKGCHARIAVPVSLIGLIAGVLFCAPTACGGQGQPASAKKPAMAHAARKKHRHILRFIPTYGVASVQSATPLTAHEKFSLAVEESSNPFAIAEDALKAQYYRATEPRKKIGHGGTGYLKQWGASYLNGLSGSMFGTFVYPVLLHQDPRYYRRGEGSIARRIVYSVSRVFVTRSDEGRSEFNASTVLGSATSTALSNVYYPPQARGVGRTIDNIGWSLLGDAGSNIFDEFWPDFVRKFGMEHR